MMFKLRTGSEPITTTPGRGVHPPSDERGEDDGDCASPEVEREFEHNARDDDVCGSADGEDDAVQRASARLARPPASSDP